MSANINLGRLYTLLVVWLVLLIAPAALELLGTFGHFDTMSDVVGPMIGIWIVGYLAQFGIFMWISRIVNPGILAWFAASMLPWALDWTTPVSPLFTALWVVVAVGFAVDRLARAPRRVAARARHPRKRRRAPGVSAVHERDHQRRVHQT
jgi:hypothetical protein